MRSFGIEDIVRVYVEVDTKSVVDKLVNEVVVLVYKMVGGIGEELKFY